MDVRRSSAGGLNRRRISGGQYYSPFQVLLDSLKIPYIALRDHDWGDPRRYPENRFFSLGGEIEAFLDSSGIADLRKSVEEEVGRSKRRVASVLATRLLAEQVPDIFDQVLRAAVELTR